MGNAAIVSRPLVNSRPSLRTMTSRRKAGSVVAPAAALGRSSWMIEMRENTAVISRNVIITLKMSIIGTSISSTGLAGGLRRGIRPMASLLSLFSGGPDVLDVGLLGGATRAQRKDVQVLDRGHFQALDHVLGPRRQERVQEQQRHGG